MHWLRLLRIPQWIKNLILLLPVFFAGKLGETERLFAVAGGVLAFCLAASAIYILNDWLDMAADRLHPLKMKRPLASGAVKPGTGLAVALVLAFGAAGLASFLPFSFMLILCAYLLMNLAYSLGLKHIAVLDVAIVGLGFLARILAGGVLADVPISKWIVLVSFLLALFLALAKRRDDVLLFEQNGEITRKVVTGYNLPFISSAQTLMAGVVVVAYIMYTISPEVIERTGSGNLYLTSFYVIAGVLKYLQITLVQNKSGDPVKVLLKNPFMQILVAAWLITLGLIIYYPQMI